MDVPSHPKIFLRLDRVLDWINVFSLLSVTLLMFLQVVLRYVFRAPLMGVEELCAFPAVWLYLFSAVKCSSERSHLVARVLEIFCRRRRAQFALRVLAACCSSLVLMWLTWWGYDYLKYALRIRKHTPSLYLPTLYYEACVFAALALMLLYTLLEVAEMTRLLKNAERNAPAVKEDF